MGSDNYVDDLRGEEKRKRTSERVNTSIVLGGHFRVSVIFRAPMKFELVRFLEKYSHD